MGDGRLSVTGRRPMARRRFVLIAALVVLVTGACASSTGPGAATTSTTTSTTSATTTTTSPSTTGSTSTTTTTPSASGTPTVPAVALPAPTTAAAALATIEVRPLAPHAGYARARFGPAWADVDHNGCDTRNDVLNRDLTGLTWRPGTHGCVVLAGTLVDPYTGRTIAFTKAHATAVQIDHVVALSDAWSTGAQAWTPAQREQLANDPLELLAVDGPTNEAKGDDDAAAWLPPNEAFRCAYVARQVAVKARWHLWMTPAEHDAIAAQLARCPGQALPTS